LSLVCSDKKTGLFYFQARFTLIIEMIRKGEGVLCWSITVDFATIASQKGVCRIEEIYHNDLV
jgi:hypothetical protein